jgi:hypothetical protein
MAGHTASFIDRRMVGRSDESVVETQGTNDRLIPFAAFFELVHVKTAILILVHHLEDLLDSFLRCVFVFGELNHRTDL